MFSQVSDFLQISLYKFNAKDVLLFLYKSNQKLQLKMKPFSFQRVICSKSNWWKVKCGRQNAVFWSAWCCILIGIMSFFDRQNTYFWSASRHRPDIGWCCKNNIGPMSFPTSGRYWDPYRADIGPIWNVCWVLAVEWYIVYLLCNLPTLPIHNASI